MTLDQRDKVSAVPEWRAEYERKLMSLDDCLDRFVPDDTSVFCGSFEVAGGIIRPILRRVLDGKLQGIRMFGGITIEPIPELGQLKDFPPEVFRFYNFFTGPNERAGIQARSTTYVPMHLHRVAGLADHGKPDVAVIPMTPPDEFGYCNIGHVGCRPEALAAAKHVIAQINPSTPWVHGLERNVHVSEIDAFVEIDQKMTRFTQKATRPEERVVAQYCADLIPNGSCLQLGFGTIANAICDALDGHKHLGVHSEMFNDGMAHLQERGVIDNSRKNYLPGVSVVGFALGTQYLYDFIDHNTSFCFTPFSHVNTSTIIAKNDNMRAINSALAVDLLGQVSAESMGFRQYSGTGGQVDFVRGAMHSKGGKAIIAMTSVAETSQGPVSKIVLNFEPGTAVTTLRSDVQYVVTEYGAVNLQYRDIPTRAKMLISIAHPDYRERLTYDAKKTGLIY